MTAEEALAQLQEGNGRFVAGRPAERDLMQQVRQTRNGQSPFAAVLGCIDSRVPPELVFDQGIGDIFSVRVAGNFVNEDVLGSLEFACKVAGASLIVVLGHSHCGAVMGACDGVRLGHLTGMLGHLKPAVDAVPVSDGERTSENAAFVRRVAEKNVELSVAAIRARSPVLREMEDQGAIAVVGAMYDVASGVVTFR